MQFVPWILWEMNSIALIYLYIYKDIKNDSVEGIIYHNEGTSIKSIIMTLWNSHEPIEHIMN